MFNNFLLFSNQQDFIIVKIAFQFWELLFSILPFLFYCLGIPTVILCITIKIASSGLPKVKESLKGQKNKLLFWLYFYLITYLITIILSYLSNYAIYAEDIIAGEMTKEDVDEINKSLLLWVVSIAIISWIGFYYLIVNLWSQIPKDVARLTPQNAALLSLIPILNIYGWFITFCILFADMNKTTQRYQQPTRLVEPSIAVGICIFWVVTTLLDLLLTVLQEILEIQSQVGIIHSILFIMALANIIFTTLFFIYLYNNTVKLLAMEQ
jgi:hypothetical protein